MVARLAERRADAGVDPLHEVYDFAYWAAEQAPAGSPLALLPVIPHAGRYRVLAAAGLEPADPADSGHWTGRRARQVMKAAFDWWLEWEHEGHPRRLVDLNFLAHAKCCEGRSAEARDGLGQALWFLCEIDAGIARREEAYAEFRHEGENGRAAGIALWLVV